MTPKGHAKQDCSGFFRPRDLVHPDEVAGVWGTSNDCLSLPQVLVGRDQVAYPFGQFVSRDVLGVDVQLREDHLRHGPLYVRAARLVEGSRVTQQGHGGQEEFPADFEPRPGVFHLLLDLGSFGLDAVELALELGLRPAGLSDQVQVLVFLGIKLLQASRQALLQGAQAAQLAQGRVFHQSAHSFAEGVTQSHGGVVAGHGCFNLLDPHVGLVALMVLSSPAQVVEVRAAIPVPGDQNQASAAASAPQHPLEVVVVGPLSDAAASVQRQYPLYPVEQLRRHQRLVPSRELLAVVVNDAGVVAVGQDVVELVEAERLGGGALGASGHQTRRAQPVQHFPAAVLAGGIQLKPGR